MVSDASVSSGTICCSLFLSGVSAAGWEICDLGDTQPQIVTHSNASVTA